MHTYAPDEAGRLKERISSKFNCAEPWLTEFSPVMGTPVAPGRWALLFIRIRAVRQTGLS